MNAINQEIQSALASNEIERARAVFNAARQQGTADAETYYLASQIAIDTDQRRVFLEKAVELNPFHTIAYQNLQLIRNSSSSLPASPVPTPAGNSHVEAQKTSQPVGWIIATLLLAVVSLVFIPILTGGLAIFCAYKVSQQDKALGQIFMVVAIIALILGLGFGFLMGMASVGM